MRIAIFSDIHGNVVGLRAVLDKIKSLGGADEIFALGDFLAVGPGGDDLIDMLQRHGARMVRGNWDEIFIDVDAYLEKLPADVHDVVLRQYEWLIEHTSPETRALIAGLPLTDELEIEPGRRLFACHAAPDDTWSRTCGANVDTKTLQDVYGGIEADVVAYGHYHNHHVINLGEKLLTNVASVGMKRGGLSSLTMLEFAYERWTIQQYQVPYDTDEFERLTRERGVPPGVAKPRRS